MEGWTVVDGAIGDANGLRTGEVGLAMASSLTDERGDRGSRVLDC